MQIIPLPAGLVYCPIVDCATRVGLEDTPIMTTAKDYRMQAETLYQLSRENPDRVAAFAQILQANDFESKAKKLEHRQISKGD
jgi:hypothetical protein